MMLRQRPGKCLQCGKGVVLWPLETGGDAVFCTYTCLTEYELQQNQRKDTNHMKDANKKTKTGKPEIKKTAAAAEAPPKKKVAKAETGKTPKFESRNAKANKEAAKDCPAAAYGFQPASQFATIFNRLLAKATGKGASMTTEAIFKGSDLKDRSRVMKTIVDRGATTGKWKLKKLEDGTWHLRVLSGEKKEAA